MPPINADQRTIDSFGAEWGRFDQTTVAAGESHALFEQYFRIFPWSEIPSGGGTAADFGCGSGRWAALVAPRVAKLHLVDASSEALNVARRNLHAIANVEFHQADVNNAPLAETSLDWAYSLGVLHHLPHTEQAIAAIARKLKPGAPLLLYLYYALDNRAGWYRVLWRASDVVRRCVSRLPRSLKFASAEVFAALVYWPLARSAAFAARLGMNTRGWPLAYYADRSFYIMRNDALDRLGTPLERRFTRSQIEAMLRRCGFAGVVFSDSAPYWCVVARAHGARSIHT